MVAGQVKTRNLKIFSGSRILCIVYKGPKYRFPSLIDFKNVGKKKHLHKMISVIDGVNECVEPHALKSWKVSIFNIVDRRIKFHSQNSNILPPEPKSAFRHLQQGIQEFHRNYVFVPADKAATKVIVV